MTARRLTIDYDGDPLPGQTLASILRAVNAHAPGIVMEDVERATCPFCNNTGRVWLPKPTYGPPRYHAHPCRDCGGEG